jgi:protein O-GlcNAc transferase
VKKIKRRKKNKSSGLNGLPALQETDRNAADAYHNAGYDFHRKRQIDDAIIYYQKAIQLNPSHEQALYNLAAAFHEKNQIDKAIYYYQKALQLNSQFIGAYYNLGTIFQGKKLFDEAIACYRKAIQLNPNLVDPYYNMGVVLQEQGKTIEALAAYDKALQINPSFTSARWARCICRIPIIYQSQSGIETSRARYRDELVKLKDGIPLHTSQEVEAAVEAVGKQQPFFLAYQGRNDKDLQQLYGDLVCRIMSSKYPEFADRPPMPPCLAEEPLRVGIVSGFFYYHAAWKIPTKGWLKNIDKGRFKLYGYYTGKKKDKETEIAKRCFSRFTEEVRPFEELCRTIRNDNLHILIYPEIGMDPATIKLAALRLAPIQCASWGHPDTSGLQTIDYYLSSSLIEPPDGEKHYTEQLIRLPNLSIYYDPPQAADIVLSRESLGLRPKSVLYHCFQSLYKYLPQYDEVFPRIAQQTGDCQFLFVSYPHVDSVVEQFRSRIGRTFNRFNLKAEDYVVILPPLPPEQYYALNGLADVYLDTIGWSGCNSVLEALACNLPVVTLPTKLMRGREGFAILTMMGVTETIAGSIDDFADIAVRLGNDAEWRRRISEKVSSGKHLVYEDRTCIAALEDFLERAVKERLE